MVNKWIGIGRLTKDVETRYSQDGSAIASFSIACSESWKEKGSGEKKERVEFVRIVAFKRLAEICGEFLVKGKLIFLEGRLQTRKYDKDNITHYITEVVASTMQMLDSKGSGQGQGNDQAQGTPDTGSDDSSIPF